MITKRTGHGQTICKGCKEKGKFGLNWDSFLYNFNDEPYCFECLMETLEIYQDRIDKAIEVIDTQMKLAEDEAKDNLRIIKFYLIKGSCSMHDLTTEEDYKYKKGGNNEC